MQFLQGLSTKAAKAPSRPKTSPTKAGFISPEQILSQSFGLHSDPESALQRIKKRAAEKLAQMQARVDAQVVSDQSGDNSQDKRDQEQRDRQHRRDEARREKEHRKHERDRERERKAQDDERNRRREEAEKAKKGDKRPGSEDGSKSSTNTISHSGSASDDDDDDADDDDEKIIEHRGHLHGGKAPEGHRKQPNVIELDDDESQALSGSQSGNDSGTDSTLRSVVPTKSSGDDSEASASGQPKSNQHRKKEKEKEKAPKADASDSDSHSDDDFDGLVSSTDESQHSKVSESASSSSDGIPLKIQPQTKDRPRQREKERRKPVQSSHSEGSDESSSASYSASHSASSTRSLPEPQKQGEHPRRPVTPPRLLANGYEYSALSPYRERLERSAAKRHFYANAPQFDVISGACSHDEFFIKPAALKPMTTSYGSSMSVVSENPMVAELELSIIDSDDQYAEKANAGSVRESMLEILQMGLNAFSLDSDSFAPQKMAFLLAWSTQFSTEQPPRVFQVALAGECFGVIAGTLYQNGEEVDLTQIPSVAAAYDQELHWMVTELSNPVKNGYAERIRLVDQTWAHNLGQHMLTLSQQKAAAVGVADDPFSTPVADASSSRLGSATGDPRTGSAAAMKQNGIYRSNNSHASPYVPPGDSHEKMSSRSTGVSNRL